MIRIARKHGKAEEVNLLYLKTEEKKKSQKGVPSKRPSSKSKKKTSTARIQETSDREIFNFEEEFIIGVTPIIEDKKKESSKSNVKSKKAVPKKAVSQKDKQVLPKNKEKKKSVSKTPKLTKKQEEKMKRNRKIKKVLKWVALIIILCVAVVLFLMSPIFDVKEIQVIGNEQIPEEEILSLSEIEIGQNTYRMVKTKVVQNIKTNPYIKKVEITRQLPDKINITIQERHAKYQLEYGNAYVYIDSQGHLLEISEVKLEVPILMGYTTQAEKIEPGNRLETEDLQKLESISKITEAAKTNGIEGAITRIDITNKEEYKIVFETEEKIAYLPDAAEINERMLMIKLILEKEKGNKGTIHLIKDKDFRFLPEA